jgi:hypothetical protein
MEKTTMPRKSLASLETAPIKAKDARLPPPETLNPRQKSLWLCIVDALPANWFTPAEQPLLVNYVESISFQETVSRQIKAGNTDIRDSKILHDIYCKQAGLIASLATKMRLTQQSKYTEKTAATATARIGGKRPWDPV